MSPTGPALPCLAPHWTCSISAFLIRAGRIWGTFPRDPENQTEWDSLLPSGPRWPSFPRCTGLQASQKMVPTHWCPSAPWLLCPSAPRISPSLSGRRIQEGSDFRGRGEGRFTEILMCSPSVLVSSCLGPGGGYFASRPAIKALAPGRARLVSCRGRR